MMVLLFLALFFGLFRQNAEAAQVQFSHSGFLEYEYFLNTEIEQDFNDASKKHQLRNHTQFRSGTETLYLYLVSNQYYLADSSGSPEGKGFRYAEESQVSRNLTLSSENYEISFNEFYLNYSTPNFRMRAGNQVYGWGTTDVTNPTAYFNPPDIREFVFRGEDESKPGIPSLSGMAFMDAFTLEVVFAPVHVPEISAPNNDFWAIQVAYPNTHRLYFETEDGLDVTLENAGLGARLTTNFGGADMAVSFYRGPDNKSDAIKVPTEIRYIPNDYLQIAVEPSHEIIHAFGADFSMTVNQFVVQLEAIYSPDNPALVDQEDKPFSDLIFPFQVKKTDYVAFAAGFNWFVPLHTILEGHEGESVFTCEYSKAMNLDSDVSKPFVPDLLTFRYDDSFLESTLSTSFTAVVDTQSGSYILWPQIGYDFQNGFKTDISYGYIKGTGKDSGIFDPIFHYFDTNDVIMWRLRYEY